MKKWYENTWLYLILLILTSVMAIISDGFNLLNTKSKYNDRIERKECVDKLDTLNRNYMGVINSYLESDPKKPLSFNLDLIDEYSDCNINPEEEELAALNNIKKRLILLLGEILDQEISLAVENSGFGLENDVKTLLSLIEKLCNQFLICNAEETLSLKDIKDSFQ